MKAQTTNDECRIATKNEGTRKKTTSEIRPKADHTVAWGNAPGNQNALMFWPKAIFTLSIVMRFRCALQRTMNMAFGQRMETVPRAWGVAPGYGEQRPLANRIKLFS